MDNYISVFVALLEHAEIYTKEEAEKIASELRLITVPNAYEDARTVVKDILDKVKK